MAVAAPVTRLEAERVDGYRHNARRAIEQLTGRIDGDGDVMIHVARLGVGGLAGNAAKIAFAAN